MKNSKVVKSYLVVAGIVGILVGGANLMIPIAFNASSGIDLNDNLNLINEMRASGGGLLASSLVVFLGAFIGRLRFSSLLLSVMIYLGYGLGRCLSMLIDGMPSEEMIQIVMFELLVGVVGLYVFLKYKEKF